MISINISSKKRPELDSSLSVFSVKTVVLPPGLLPEQFSLLPGVISRPPTKITFKFDSV